MVKVAGSRVRKPKTVTTKAVKIRGVAPGPRSAVASSAGTSGKTPITLKAKVAPAGEQPALSVRTLSGIVTETTTGKGIGGATVVSYTPDARGYSTTGKPVIWFTVATDAAGRWSWTGTVGALGPGGSLRVEASDTWEGVDAPDLLDVPEVCDSHGSPDGGCWQSADDTAREVMAWRAAHGWGPMTYPLSAGCANGQWTYRQSALASGTARVMPIANLMGSAGHFRPVAGGAGYETPGYEYGLAVTVYGGGRGEGWGVKVERHVCLK
jgi:hypothetical protein